MQQALKRLDFLNNISVFETSSFLNVSSVRTFLVVFAHYTVGIVTEDCDAGMPIRLNEKSFKQVKPSRLDGGPPEGP